jgi:hypothetical protein
MVLNEQSIVPVTPPPVSETLTTVPVFSLTINGQTFVQQEQATQTPPPPPEEWFQKYIPKLGDFCYGCNPHQATMDALVLYMFNFTRFFCCSCCTRFKYSREWVEWLERLYCIIVYTYFARSLLKFGDHQVVMSAAFIGWCCGLFPARIFKFQILNAVLYTFIGYCGILLFSSLLIRQKFMFWSLSWITTTITLPTWFNLDFNSWKNAFINVTQAVVFIAFNVEAFVRGVDLTSDFNIALGLMLFASFLPGQGIEITKESDSYLLLGIRTVHVVTFWFNLFSIISIFTFFKFSTQLFLVLEPVAKEFEYIFGLREEL